MLRFRVDQEGGDAGKQGSLRTNHWDSALGKEPKGDLIFPYISVIAGTNVLNPGEESPPLPKR
tara:strand:- start:523 stop:711 length:189 start_codon:yes stop_codon:yes gene_type:complete